MPVPVCETAFALARKFQDEMKEGGVRIKVVFPGSVKHAFGGADLHKELDAAFERKNIQVLYDIPINEITPEEILSTEKHRIGYDLLMLVPPFRGQAILNHLGSVDDDDFITMLFGELDHLAHGGATAFLGRIDARFTPQIKLVNCLASFAFRQRVRLAFR